MNKTMKQLYRNILRGKWKIKQSWLDKIKGRINGCYKVKLIGLTYVITPVRTVMINDNTHTIGGNNLSQQTELVYSLKSDSIYDRMYIIKPNGRALKYEERLYFDGGYFTNDRKPVTFIEQLWYQLTRPRYL